nr:hypothetical protein [Tanacetum cinerariifolium]
FNSTKPVNIYYDGVFVENPFVYMNGDFKVIDDVDFDGLLYVQMYDIIRRYDIMEMIQDQLAPKYQPVMTSFKCNADDVAHISYENLDDLKDIVDFEVEGEENVVITRNTTDDLWLNKLVGNGTFISQTDDATSNLGVRFNHEENDLEDDIVDPKEKKPKEKNIVKDKCSSKHATKKPKEKNNDEAECSFKPETMKENKDNWAWFLSLLQEDLELGYGGGVIVISDGHKGSIVCKAYICQLQKKVEWASI